MKCEDVYRRQRLSDGSTAQTKVETFDFEPPEKLQSFNSDYYNWNQYPTEFECVQYEIIYARTNRREFVRKCQGRNEIPNFCNALQEQGYRNGYSLAKCDVCASDYCNSSIKIKISLLLNFLFFLVFYQCTS
ncbi:hypothetical protein ILUMI_16308 [Ignelater luminosus]|uniref:Protein quiver n=1 Tax=Ignelater luminosus TaxID=2038154 RepID=A0A8K0CM46_IGNLU|nr:hypothetical protein ILUMI_16308 [Ignelater luminosus]